MTEKESGARVSNKGKFVNDNVRSKKKEKMTRKRRRMVPVTRKG